VVPIPRLLRCFSGVPGRASLKTISCYGLCWTYSLSFLLVSVFRRLALSIQLTPSVASCRSCVGPLEPKPVQSTVSNWSRCSNTPSSPLVANDKILSVTTHSSN
jgi:hypothetical protein